MKKTALSFGTQTMDLEKPLNYTVVHLQVYVFGGLTSNGLFVLKAQWKKCLLKNHLNTFKNDRERPRLAYGLCINHSLFQEKNK